MDIRIEPAEPHELKRKPDQNALGFGRYLTDHMFVMTYHVDRGWHDAVIRRHQPFWIDPAAMVLHYGQAIFEGMKAFRGKDDKIRLFRPEANFERMNVTADRMCMPFLPVADVLAALKRLVRLDQEWVPSVEGASLYIRPAMIATEPGLGVRPAKEYLFFIIKGPVGAYYPEGFNPIRIFITDKYVRAVRGGVGNVKTAGNYAASIKAAVEAKAQGYTQVLWLDAIERRYIEEVGTSNIFFVIGEEVVTPALTGSILPGITRDSVLRLTRDWGFKVTERPIAIDEVIAASKDGSLKEVFGTGTAAVISPVGTLCYQGEQIIVNGQQAGPLSKQLFDELQGIQYGTRTDPYGWAVVV